MELLCKVKWPEALSRGQTMTEYVLIVSAIAVAVLAAYQKMGTTLTGLVASISGSL
jgi:Flp pilus assembly pilin Flp